MKIDLPTPSTAPLGRAPRAGVSANGAAAATQPSVGSTTARVYQLVGANNPDFDAARVAAIREDIRTGRYQPNPERIADGLMASVRDLLKDDE